MIRITAAEFQKRYGRYTKLASEGEVVMITSHSKDRSAIISADLLAELLRLARRESMLTCTATVEPPRRAAGQFQASAASLPFAGVIRPEAEKRGNITLGQLLSGAVDIDEEPPGFVAGQFGKKA